MDPARIQQALAQPRVQALLRSLGVTEEWTVASTKTIRAFNEGDDDDGRSTGQGLSFAYQSLPDPPVTPDAPLASAVLPGNDGVDRISCLPDQILRNVVSRLPALDAVRTGALATRWRGLWRSVPLVFVDTHLLPASKAADPGWRPGLEDTFGIINAVNGALAAHPGPFRCVHISCCYMDLDTDGVDRLFNHLAAKDVQELAFINRPWPLDLPLPATLFSCTSLTRLHIGAWKLPDTAALPCTAAFPNLQELCLSLMEMKDRDLAFLLDRSPVLEVLTIIVSQADVRLCLVSRSLRCLHLAWCRLGDIAVADAPRLERFCMYFTFRSLKAGGKCARIKIGKAPKLSMLGYWHPGQHELQIGKTIIEADTKASPSTIIPSVKILAFQLQFDAPDEAKTLPSFLRCFPNVETLHINSLNFTKPAGKVNLNFWQEAGPIECVQRRIKKAVIHWFQGKRGEQAFLKFIAERAEVLEKIVIVMPPECFTSLNAAKAKLGPLMTAKWASKDFKVTLFKHPIPEAGPAPWYFRKPTDFSCDPFDVGSTEDNLRRGGAVVLGSGIK